MEKTKILLCVFSIAVGACSTKRNTSGSGAASTNATGTESSTGQLASTGEIDLTNTDCRPTGETCNSGPGNGCCEVCDKTQNPPICIHGAGTCHVNGAGCTKDADCCNGQCLPNNLGMLTCQIPCFATGAS